VSPTFVGVPFLVAYGIGSPNFQREIAGRGILNEARYSRFVINTARLDNPVDLLRLTVGHEVGVRMDLPEASNGEGLRITLVKEFFGVVRIPLCVPSKHVSQKNIM
jgi:hypothetical protein